MSDGKERLRKLKSRLEMLKYTRKYLIPSWQGGVQYYLDNHIRQREVEYIALRSAHK